ncbi:cysteine synthase A [Evtepia sp.]|uniref:cysteine synthase A n=1 Tax=Evtepia sp. TaxID=2773933 RepID=UPI002A819306|nr:cysteine synthase A [Evtepia sp.]MDY4431056.1 cysteine synthase A [Evtepia sp.]
MVYQNVLEALGNTPLIRLSRMVPAGSADVLVKYEGVNIGGSIKTRTACNMILDAEARGLLTPDTVIVEPTSGNQGIGLALVGAVKGYRVRIIMPDSVSEERRKLIQAYGAELVLIHDDGDIGACIQACLDTANRMAREDKNVWVPQQFENPSNPAVHKAQTAMEILDQVEGEIHGFCSGVGTGGTLSGVGAVLKDRFPDLKIWVAEPQNAAILSQGPIGSHLQMGIGDGLIPDNLDMTIFDQVSIVTDQEAIQTAQRLMREEGILCGISSGSNVTVALRMAKELGEGKTVVTILPDTGERYFSTQLFDI